MQLFLMQHFSERCAILDMIFSLFLSFDISTFLSFNCIAFLLSNCIAFLLFICCSYRSAFLSFSCSAFLSFSCSAFLSFSCSVFLLRSALPDEREGDDQSPSVHGGGRSETDQDRVHRGTPAHSRGGQTKGLHLMKT